MHITCNTIICVFCVRHPKCKSTKGVVVVVISPPLPQISSTLARSCETPPFSYLLSLVIEDLRLKVKKNVEPLTFCQRNSTMGRQQNFQDREILWRLCYAKIVHYSYMSTHLPSSLKHNIFQPVAGPCYYSPLISTSQLHACNIPRTIFMRCNVE